jgi:glycerol-3-phosphate O-acyltransferase/dihydroxyacetone phosphate acyltransferase
VERYNRTLKVYGIRDHQVKNTSTDVRKALGIIIVRLLEVFILGLLCSPILVLFYPLAWITRKVSQEKAAEAVANSDVKIKGIDVITSWKVLTAAVVAPILWVFYTVAFH